MNARSRPRVGVLALAPFAPNVDAFLTNLGRLVAGEVDLDLVTDAPLPASVVRWWSPHLVQPRARTRGLRRLESALGLARYARERTPSVLTHVTDIETNGVAVTIAGVLTGTPTIARYAGQVLEAYRLERTVAGRARTFALCNVLGQLPLRRATRILTLGPRLAAELRRHGVDARRIATIPQPVDLAAFAPGPPRAEIRERLGLPLDRTIVLFVGRLEWLKGSDVFLRIVPDLVRRRPSLSFLFVGDGPYRDALAALGPAVTVRSGVTRADVADHYRAADVFAYPSRIDGLPTVLLEAMAAGLPVVARDVGEVATATSHLFTKDHELAGWLMAPAWEREHVPGFLDGPSTRDAYVGLFRELAR